MDQGSLEDLYDEKELFIGSKVQVPWKVKGKTTYWNAVIVDPASIGRGTYSKL